MDGPTHYSMAEHVMEQARDALNEGAPDGRVAALIALSQVHATLAAAAAAALGQSGADGRAWRDVAGTGGG